MHHLDCESSNRPGRNWITIVGLLLSLQLICIGVAATESSSAEAEPAEEPFVFEQQQLDSIEKDQQIRTKAAPSCDTNRTCTGLVTDMVNWFLVQKDQVRVVLGNSTVKQRLLAFGCTENWSLWMHNDTNRDLMLNQLVMAEKFGDTVMIVFKKDPNADHCDIDYVYRGVP